ncbi:MAG TPA: PqqD family protein [Thermoanaerobaculia bacterium]|nr:PqqD family protein [Thermoanaerobaculia bacterium]
MAVPSPTETIYRIRRPEVVSEVFEGEAVVVDLKQGRYYSLSPCASEIWSRLESSPSLAELVIAARERFGDAGCAHGSLAPFVDSLVATGLVAVDVRPAGQAPPQLDPISANGGDRHLAFETFTDLEDLLVLDPIHELDETGWPLPPESRET